MRIGAQAVMHAYSRMRVAVCLYRGMKRAASELLVMHEYTRMRIPVCLYTDKRARICLLVCYVCKYIYIYHRAGDTTRQGGGGRMERAGTLCSAPVSCPYSPSSTVVLLRALQQYNEGLRPIEVPAK